MLSIRSHAQTQNGGRTASLLSVAVLTAAVLLSQTQNAVADEPGQISTLTVDGEGFNQSNADLVLNFDTSISAVQVEDVLQSIGVDPLSLHVDGSQATATSMAQQSTSVMPTSAPSARLSVTATPMAGPTGGASLRCNQYYSWADGNGTYTLQHACGGTTAPWSYRIAAPLQSVIVGNVSESGMSWTRNGTAMPRQAPHTVGASYLFHGTYNPAPDGSHILYQDTISFRHNISGGGSGIISFNGDFNLSSVPPCGSGGPC